MTMTNAAQPLIRVRGLTKEFTFWHEQPSSLKTLLIDLVRGKLSMGRFEKIKLFENIDFEVYPGEFVGLMGRNGAGKSTLFKLLCGIYQPTAGKIEVSAGITPLIELGAGFNGELSGYENIFLNSAILGFGRKATLDALPSILAFSELGDKIHMPVKNYSSGMLVRLGFSIATHLISPILLIDEVLAVGDAKFQKKCLEKITELHNKGITILLVTHDPESVRDYCNRCIVIGNQQKLHDGEVEKGIETYLSL